MKLSLVRDGGKRRVVAGGTDGNVRFLRARGFNDSGETVPSYGEAICIVN